MFYKSQVARLAMDGLVGFVFERPSTLVLYHPGVVSLPLHPSSLGGPISLLVRALYVQLPSFGGRVL